MLLLLDLSLWLDPGRRRLKYPFGICDESRSWFRKKVLRVRKLLEWRLGGTIGYLLTLRYHRRCKQTAHAPSRAAVRDVLGIETFSCSSGEEIQSRDQ